MATVTHAPGIRTVDPAAPVLLRRPAELADAVPPGLPDELASWLPLVRRIGDAPIDAGTSVLVEEALGVLSRPGFETFVSLPRLRFEPYPHQLQAAERALRRMRGRAILADEVGLGKTIEAALVASELRLRGLARRVLVLVPAGLVAQWQEELDRKFALPSVVAGGDGWPAQDDDPIVIASLATARRAGLRRAIESQSWDLVVADEAHRLRNPQTASSKLVRAVRTRYLLLLTATPVCGRLDDLFNLVSLVRPGHLGTPREFRARYGRETQLAELQTRTREVMVRHRRSEVALTLPRRLARTTRVRPSDDEAVLYRLVSDRVRERGRDAPAREHMALSTVQRMAGSSPPALAATLERMGWNDLAGLARAVSATRKAQALLDVVRRHLDAGEKVVVFTAFRHTLDHLARLLNDNAIDAVAYHGSLPRAAKHDVVGTFEREAPVLLTTEAAGEGRNLQFCHVMVNYDLPWNPMQIEQRLGRIHRIGQHHDVELTNLVTRDTIEDRILRVLENRINLFELVVGELDMILGRVDDDWDLETAVFRAHVSSRDDDELAGRLDAIGDDLARARDAYLEGRERTDSLVGEDAG